MTTTRLRRLIAAPRAVVYRALLDPHAVAAWKVPQGMTCEVHELDARVGGAIHVTLRYEQPTGTGKTTAHSDSYRGRFTELVPDERVVEVDEFETDDPAMRGAMTIAITLADADGGTELLAVHEGLPPGVSTADNETGWRMALDRLAALVETVVSHPPSIAP
ncbi:MAG TPA: SRPBCC family protein [Gemmatimonadaceae bacterium]|nr:SRPBCC family protein [Gemmatimonadaceae bacterium]